MKRVEKVRVLIADDDALLRDIAVATFEGAGFEVEVVTTGNAAVAACATRMPDIALLDVEMPNGTGYQACAARASSAGSLSSIARSIDATRSRESAR